MEHRFTIGGQLNDIGWTPQQLNQNPMAGWYGGSTDTGTEFPTWGSTVLASPWNPVSGWESIDTSGLTNNSWIGLSKPESYGGSTMDEIKGMSLPKMPKNNPFNKQNIGATMGAVAAAAASPVGDLIGKGIAGGRENKVGDSIDTIGTAVGTGLMTVNPLIGGAVVLGSKLLGGFTKAGFGVKYNKENIADIENNISGMKNSANNLARVNTNEGLFNAWGNASNGYDFNTKYVGKNGWFNKKATKKAKSLSNQQNTARSMMAHSLLTGAGNADKTVDTNALASFAANGGLLNINNEDMGAMEYNFMSDYLNMRDRQNSIRNSIPNNYFTGLPQAFANGGGIHIEPSKRGTFTAAATKHGMGVQEFADFSPLMRRKANFARNYGHRNGNGGTLFAIGGDLQTHGADWGNLTHVDAGGTHEESPYDGVPMGIAPDGQPNLVEEGEVIYNDYVFSNRLKPGKDVLRKLHIFSKGGKMTYADVAKKLEDEIKERPNDPISRAALEANMKRLADAQEMQKQKQEEERIMQAFEELSPEEKRRLLEDIAMRQQQAQQQEEQSSEEQEASQEQQISQEEQPQGTMAAFGGTLHKYDNGGWKGELSKILGRLTVSDWNNWAGKLGVKDFDFGKLSSIDDLLKYEALKEDLAKTNPELIDALGRGYRFGTKAPLGRRYDWNSFMEKLKDYTNSNKAGNTPDNYIPDEGFLKEQGYADKYKTIKDLENAEFYSDYTKDMLSLVDRLKNKKWKLNKEGNGFIDSDGTPLSIDDYNFINALYATVKGTSTNPNGDPVGLFVNGDGYTRFRDNASDFIKNNLRGDRKGGIFHLTPNTVNNTSDTTNLMYGNNGYENMTAVPGNMKPFSTYNYYDDDGNKHTINYFKTPKKRPAPNNGNNDGQLPYDKLEKLRYAGLLGPVAGGLMWAAGVGKPDYSGLDVALNTAMNGNTGYANTKYIGNYLTYKPVDRQTPINRYMRQFSNTRDGIMNTSAPVGTKQGSLLINNQQALDSLGDLYAKSNEADDKRLLSYAAHNTGIDTQNANAYNQASLTNAQLQSRDKEYMANLQADIAARKIAADASWYGNLYGNVRGLFNGLADLGREAAQRNMIEWVANHGGFGVMPDDARHGLGYYSAANGGRIHKKKGLTF
jgi:hypothetical protein